MTQTDIPDKIIIWAVKAISGEITKNMRMVAFSYVDETAKFRFYVADKPSEDDKESGEIIALNFDSGLPKNLKSLDVEFVTTKAPLGTLDPLGFILFRRNEGL